MTARPVCPTHGPLAGLYVCWVDDCGWDARDVDTGLRADDEPEPSPETPTDTEPRVIVLPWDCLVSVNKRSGAESRTSKEWRDALRASRRIVSVQVAAQGWQTLSGPVSVRMDFHPPDNRRRDETNLCKAILDSLETYLRDGCVKVPGVYEDDVQVREWSGHVNRVDPDEPRVVIEVRAVEQREARSA